MSKLMILDGNSIVNRAFYGIRLLNAPDGTPTNGIYGFLSILQKLVENQRPDALCVAFDVHAPTFRHKMYSEYKGKRKPMPEDLVVQIPLLKEVLHAMGIRCYEKAGWEADDILGTAGRRCEEEGWECLIVSGDKDSLQLVTETTHVFHVKTKMGKTEEREYTPELFREEYGFDPIHLIDLKALMGDPSDNIPGVPGVGEKTATALIQKYHSLDEVYRDLDAVEVTPRIRQKLAEGKESAYASYKLATIVKDVPIDFVPAENSWTLQPSEELYRLFVRLNFIHYLDKWNLRPGQKASASEYKALPDKQLEENETEGFLKRISRADYVSTVFSDDGKSIQICDGTTVTTAYEKTLGAEAYDTFLRKLLSEHISKVTTDLKDLIRNLSEAGYPADGFIFDTALAEYLLDATASDYAPKTLCIKYFQQEMNEAETLYRVYPEQKKALLAEDMRKLYYEIELPLCAVLARMEQAGFQIDRKALEAYGAGLTENIDRLQKAVYDKAGMEFNINSPKQLGKVLFEDLKIPSGKKTKTGWSTNADVLEKLRGRYPIVQDVLDYRMYTKLKSTYADGLLHAISPDGRLHTNFRMTVTATGRLSSTEPNLQNIPVRKELGSEIRKMFVAPEGRVLVDADYSQIELRILAHISGDEAMREAFRSGMDFHTVTASQVFGVPIDEVTPQMRSRAKAVNFGIVYGISAWALGNDIGVSTAEAKSYMDAYYRRYSGVRQYMKDIVESAREKQYVETLFGRRRALPELKSSNFATRSFGERVALNMPIQGTAADIIKLAMVNIDRRLRAQIPDARLLLQVHDELIIECDRDCAQDVMKLLKEEMENAVYLSVPLIVETNYAQCWAEAH